MIRVEARLVPKLWHRLFAEKTVFSLFFQVLIRGKKIVISDRIIMDYCTFLYYRFIILFASTSLCVTSNLMYAIGINMI